MFKILVMKDGHWFYMEKQLVLILRMMIQSLILVPVLSLDKCRLTSIEKKKLTTLSQIVMIMMKEN